MSNENSAALEVLARSLEDDPEFIAWALARYRDYEDIQSWAELATYFGTTAPFLIQLALCRRPPPAAEDFALRVRQIAEFAAVDVAALANLLRHVDFLQSLPSNDRIAATPNPMLAAARDKVEPEKHPPDGPHGPS